MTGHRLGGRGGVRERIETLCAQGLSNKAIVEQIGCNPEYADQVIRLFRSPPGRNDILKANHEGHVAAVMAEGGFLFWSEKCIGADRLGRRKMVVCPPLERAA